MQHSGLLPFFCDCLILTTWLAILSSHNLLVCNIHISYASHTKWLILWYATYMLADIQHDTISWYATYIMSQRWYATYIMIWSCGSNIIMIWSCGTNIHVILLYATYMLLICTWQMSCILVCIACIFCVCLTISVALNSHCWLVLAMIHITSQFFVLLLHIHTRPDDLVVYEEHTNIKWYDLVVCNIQVCYPFFVTAWFSLRGFPLPYSYHHTISWYATYIIRSCGMQHTSDMILWYATYMLAPYLHLPDSH